MKIKTIATVNGINLVDFGDCTSRFYWFRNLGDSTLYVSAKPNPAAGGDDVSELPPKSVTSIETTAGVVHILGAGKVEIHNVDSKFCPFRNMLISSGGGELTNEKWVTSISSDPYDLIKNTLNTSNYCGAGYETDVGNYNSAYYLQQSWSGANITHSYSIDLSNVSKITVHGSICSNSGSLSATAYACASNEELTSITDDWTEMIHTAGSDLSEFTTEINVDDITGDQYLYFGVKHGGEINSNTVYLYLYDIEFIY